jgi:multidrug efflux pump subunit AcrA (membrane-fusion protein)
MKYTIAIIPAGLLVLTVIFCGCRRAEIIHPQRRLVIEAIYVTGRIIPSQEISVVALGGGILKKCLVRNGERVTYGQLLFKLNSPSLASFPSQPSRSSGYLDPKMVTYLKGLSPTFTVPPEQMKVGMNSAVSSNRAGFELMSIRSPAAGKVFQLFHSEGETVRPGDVLAIIGHPTERILQLNVDQKDIVKIREGLKVLFRDDLHPLVTYEGTIRSIYPVLNETNYTFRVDATIPGVYPDSVFIHMPVEGNVIIRENPNALVIPRDALFNADSVMIRKGDASVKIFIKKGIQTVDHIEVVEGLDEGSSVVMPGKRNSP